MTQLLRHRGRQCSQNDPRGNLNRHSRCFTHYRSYSVNGNNKHKTLAYPATTKGFEKTVKYERKQIERESIDFFYFCTGVSGVIIFFGVMDGCKDKSKFAHDAIKWRNSFSSPFFNFFSFTLFSLKFDYFIIYLFLPYIILLFYSRLSYFPFYLFSFLFIFGMIYIYMTYNK